MDFLLLYVSLNLVLPRGVEPPHPYGRQTLILLRLPLRHGSIKIKSLLVYRHRLFKLFLVPTHSPRPQVMHQPMSFFSIVSLLTTKMARRELFYSNPSIFNNSSQLDSPNHVNSWSPHKLVAPRGFEPSLFRLKI